MSGLPGEAEAAERLRRTALRDFGPEPADAVSTEASPYRLTVTPEDAPVPLLLRYALTLIGCAEGGPDEKVAWWVNFTYKGEPCTIAHEKFGLQLHLRTGRSPEEAFRTLSTVLKKLVGTTRTVEQLILAAAPNLLKTGNVAVRNQHASLRRAYDYFCVRAQNPSHIEDETVVHKSTGSVTATSFTRGRIQMQLNAFHDMIAAISAYISLLEHDLVLSLPFTELDPNQYDLTDVIGLRWRDKWNLILDNKPDSQHFRQRLYDVVERWRNPYSHGGFEKGHDATLWLHAPPIGIFPVGLTRIRDSPPFFAHASRRNKYCGCLHMFRRS